MPFTVLGANQNLDKFINQSICFLMGHDWVYNANSLPTKSMCLRCNQKAKFSPRTLTWINVDSFELTLGTDTELKNRWTKHYK